MKAAYVPKLESDHDAKYFKYDGFYDESYALPLNKDSDPFLGW